MANARHRLPAHPPPTTAAAAPTADYAHRAAPPQPTADSPPLTRCLRQPFRLDTRRSCPPPTLQRQLTEIEMRLSRMAAASPHLWNTERLERDTEQLLAQAQSDADRNAVKVTMAKIDQFDDARTAIPAGPKL